MSWMTFILGQSHQVVDICGRIGSGRGNTSQQVPGISMKSGLPKSGWWEERKDRSVKAWLSSSLFIRMLSRSGLTGTQRRIKVGKGDGKEKTALWEISENISMMANFRTLLIIHWHFPGKEKKLFKKGHYEKNPAK